MQRVTGAIIVRPALKTIECKVPRARFSFSLDRCENHAGEINETTNEFDATIFRSFVTPVTRLMIYNTNNRITYCSNGLPATDMTTIETVKYFHLTKIVTCNIEQGQRINIRELFPPLRGRSGVSSVTLKRRRSDCECLSVYKEPYNFEASEKSAIIEPGSALRFHRVPSGIS